MEVPVMIFALFVMYSFCDEHHTTNIWEVLVDKWWVAWWKPSTCLFTDKASHRPCVEKSNILALYSSVMKTDHTTRISGGHLHTSLVDMKFSCLRRGASDDHCDICTVWSCGTHLSPWLLQDVCSEMLVDMIALFHRSWLCSSAVVRLVLALCGPVENIIPPWFVRGALSEAWNHMMAVLPLFAKRSQSWSTLHLHWVLCGTHESPWHLLKVGT